MTARWMLVEPDHAALEAMAGMMADGRLKVIVADTRALGQMAELHDIGERGGPFGKLVATID